MLLRWFSIKGKNCQQRMLILVLALVMSLSYSACRADNSMTSSASLTTHPTLTSNVKFMNFYPFDDIETISPRPMLFITGDNAHSREFSEDAYKRAAEPKDLYIVPNAGHVDLYDRVNLIPWDKLQSFFTQHLSK